MVRGEAYAAAAVSRVEGFGVELGGDLTDEEGA